MDIFTVPSNISYKRVRYREGEEISWSLEDAPNLFLLEEGSADVIFYGDDDETMRIYRYSAPDILGEVEVLTDQRSQLEILAVTDCTVLKISKEEALKWMRQDFNLCLSIMRRLCRKLMDGTDSRLDLRFKNTKERYMESMRRHEEDGSLKELTKKQLCEELCIPLRSLNRIVAQCRDQFVFRDGHFEKSKG